MENQEAKSKWDELVRELGIEATPDAPHSPESHAAGAERPADDVAELKRESRAKATPPPAKRTTTDWGALNSELGLEPPPEPLAVQMPSQPAVEPPVARSEDRPPREERAREERPRTDERPRSEERPRRERAERGSRDQEQTRPADEPRPDRSRSRSGPRRESRPRDDERAPSEERPREEGRARDESRARSESRSRNEGRSRDESRSREETGSRDESQERGDSRQGRSRSDSRRGRSRHRDDRSDDSIARSDDANEAKVERRAIEADDANLEERQAERDPAANKPASVSLWHKIFGLPTEQTAKLTGAESSEQETGDVSEAETYVREAKWSGFAPTDDSKRDSDAVSDDVEISREQDSDDASDDERRRRPRRRRRGGRKSAEARGETRDERKPPARRSRDAEVVEDSDDEFGFDDEFGGAPVRTTDSARPEFDLDDDEDFGDEGLDGDRTASKSGGHRGIPSWQDAIGAIVDLNLQSRSQRRHAAPAHGRPSAQHGRPRGRRKKKS